MPYRDDSQEPLAIPNSTEYIRFDIAAPDGDRTRFVLAIPVASAFEFQRLVEGLSHPDVSDSLRCAFQEFDRTARVAIPPQLAPSVRFPLSAPEIMTSFREAYDSLLQRMTEASRRPLHPVRATHPPVHYRTPIYPEVDVPPVAPISDMAAYRRLESLLKDNVSGSTKIALVMENVRILNQSCNRTLVALGAEIAMHFVNRCGHLITPSDYRMIREKVEAEVGPLPDLNQSDAD